MTTPDTSPENVERVANSLAQGAGLDTQWDGAALLRALLAERDNETKAANHWMKEANEEHNLAIKWRDRAEKAEAERDAYRSENSTKLTEINRLIKERDEAIKHADKMAESLATFASYTPFGKVKSLEAYRAWRGK